MNKNIVDIDLYGYPPPRWADDRIKGIHRGEYITKQKKSLVFGEALACINSTSMTEGQSLNCRAFEIAGAGGLQILEDRDSVSDCFEPGKEILTYSSLEELVDLVGKYQMDKSDALKIRIAGSSRAHKEHTYEIRLSQILNHLK